MTRLGQALIALVLLPFTAMAEMLNAHDVAPGIWAIEGPAEQRNPENLGSNATFGLIETPKARSRSIRAGRGKGLRRLTPWCGG